jgi:hypothetical protein
MNPIEIETVLIPVGWKVKAAIQDLEGLEQGQAIVGDFSEIKALSAQWSCVFWVIYSESQGRDQAEKMAYEIARATEYWDTDDDGDSSYCHSDFKIVPIDDDNPPYRFIDVSLAARNLDWIYIEPPDPDQKIRTVDTSEIAGANIEQHHIINGLLGEKETLVIPSESGGSKSLLVNFIVHQAAYSHEDGLFGLFSIPRPVTTLIVQSENATAAQSARLKKLFQARPELQGTGRVHMLGTGRDCRCFGRFVDDEFQKMTVDALLRVQADLLVIDPLISFHGAGENDNTEMRRALDALQEKILDVANCGAILTHHFNRQGKTRGASAIRDWAANFLILEPVAKEDGQALIRCIHDKARNYPEVDPFLILRTRNLDFIRSEEPGTRKDQWVAATVEALKILGGNVDRQAPLIEAVQVKLNCKITTAKSAISYACEAKKIIVSPGGSGKATGYFLPGSVPN